MWCDRQDLKEVKIERKTSVKVRNRINYREKRKNRLSIRMSSRSTIFLFICKKVMIVNIK
jgi:hypothetical protein